MRVLDLDLRTRTGFVFVSTQCGSANDAYQYKCGHDCGQPLAPRLVRSTFGHEGSGQPTARRHLEKLEIVARLFSVLVVRRVIAREVAVAHRPPWFI